MYGLGRTYNTVQLASGVHITLKGAESIEFLIYENGGATAIGLKESQSGANEQDLDVINGYWANDGVGGVYTYETVDANGALDADHSMVKKDTTPFDGAIIHVHASQLSDGFDSVECTVDGGQCVAIVYGLSVQRDPVNLPALLAS